MFNEQQRVGDTAGTAVFDERALQCERLAVRHQAQAPDIEWSSDPAHAALKGPRYI